MVKIALSLLLGNVYDDENEQVLSQTLLLRTPLGQEKVSVLQDVLIKRVNFKGKCMGWDQENCP